MAVAIPASASAFELYAKDSGKSLQDVADEAFADLLAKHQRSRSFKDALEQSARRDLANENKPLKRRGS